jgi:outer membrane lipoprotein-sorting protein
MSTLLGRRAFLAGSTLALGLAPRVVWADALDDKLRAAGAARAKIKTLTGPFTQERTIGLLATKITSTGKLALVRPDRLLWELDAPDSVSYWVGPEGLAYKGKEGHGRLPMTAKVAPALEDLRTLLGGDLVKLRERYDLTELPVDKGLAFEAVPKDKAGARFARLSMVLAEDMVRPQKITLSEGGKERTEITFGALVIDAPVDPARVRPPS